MRGKNTLVVVISIRENMPTGGPLVNQSDYPWDLTRVSFSRQSLSTFHCLYQNWNVTKTEMSLNLKCHQNLNGSKADMSPKTEMSQKRNFFQNWKVPKTCICYLHKQSSKFDRALLELYCFLQLQHWKFCSRNYFSKTSLFYNFVKLPLVKLKIDSNLFIY